MLNEKPKVELTSKNGNSTKPPVMRPLCPSCGNDTLITLSGITHCMVDGCSGVKGHNDA